MVSTYQYTTVAALEAYAAIDYSSLAPAYTDAQIEAAISFAERLINGYIGTYFTGTIPDAVVDGTLYLAQRIMYNHMIDDGIPAMADKEYYLLDIPTQFGLEDLKGQYTDKRYLYVEASTSW